MSWPTPQDYNEAVQNPRLAFTDQDLQLGQAELNPLGLPRPICGRFASVYKIENAGRVWAARCFLSEVPDQQSRYDAISHHLEQVQLKYAVPFTYLPAGIKVTGRTYPLLKMAWVQGESLDAFVGRSLDYPATLQSLARVWVRLVTDLQAAGIAHGDLQHSNVLVVGDDLRIIDYDGMFVPALAGRLATECGQRNYQHPDRTEFDFGPSLDNFSAWVVYVSIVALTIHPELWTKYRGGDECLLLRKDDFADPDNSPLLQELLESPNGQLRALVQLFISLRYFSPLDVPSLDGNQPELDLSALPARTMAASRGAWWEDHVPRPVRPASQEEKEEKEQESSSETEAEPAPDLTWIFNEQIAPMRFTAPVKTPRLFFAASCGVALLMFLFVAPSLPIILVAASALTTVNLIFCWLRYDRDPSVGQFDLFRKELAALRREMRQHRRLCDSLAKEKEQAEGSLANVIRPLEAWRAKFDQELQAELDQEQANLNGGLERLNLKRKEIAQAENNELQAVQTTIGEQIAAIDRNLSALVLMESQERDSAIRDLRQQHIDNYLRSCLIEHARIPGIDLSYKSRLSYHGITSAADIDYRVQHIPGITYSKYAALEAWRQLLETTAELSAPNQVPYTVAVGIENRYRAERGNLQNQRTLLQGQLKGHFDRIRRNAAETRRSLDGEERDLRFSSAQQIIQIRQARADKFSAIDQEIEARRGAAAPSMTELNAKLQKAQKDGFKFHWRAARQEHDREKFRRVRFRDYLLKVSVGRN
jgi:hypothetical protein